MRTLTAVLVVLAMAAVPAQAHTLRVAAAKRAAVSYTRHFAAIPRCTHRGPHIVDCEAVFDLASTICERVVRVKFAHGSRVAARFYGEPDCY